MSLQLDARQRAMLQEMGIRVYLPDAAAVAFSAQEADPQTVEPVMAGHGLDSGAAGLHAIPAFMPPGMVVPMPGPPATGPVGIRAGGIEAMQWDALADTVAHCRACQLCHGRRKTVFGMGDQKAQWMVVGEAPTEHEDLQGEPFVGQAGELLDNMLKALGLGRQSNVYVANVLKCRPPGNRNPEPEEIAQCDAFLRRQIALVQPKIILAMGRLTVQALLGTTEPIGKLRGRVHSYAGVPVVVTYHPSFLLRNLPEKARAWADLCLANAVVAGRVGELPGQPAGAAGSGGA